MHPLHLPGTPAHLSASLRASPPLPNAPHRPLLPASTGWIGSLDGLQDNRDPDVPLPMGPIDDATSSGIPRDLSDECPVGGGQPGHRNYRCPRRSGRPARVVESSRCGRDASARADAPLRGDPLALRSAGPDGGLGQRLHDGAFLGPAAAGARRGRTRAARGGTRGRRGGRAVRPRSGSVRRRAAVRRATP
jgi:hypothetical protein